ncbi:MAG: hypothetical protein NVS9B12_05240 [Vulcanimicrobiaceae bacterium]
MSARFSVGDGARVRIGNPAGHTRVPRYLRGKPGIVIALIGEFPLADESARGEASAPEPLYTLRFEGRNVWGADGEDRVWITADLWESYLEPQT